LLLSGDQLVDPFAFPYFLRLCEAIERFTDAAVTHDAAMFRVQGADLRYVVERHLYFALIADEPLYRLFVASECGTVADGQSLSEMAGLVAPFLLQRWPRPVEAPQSLWTRFLRVAYRRRSWSHFGCEGVTNGRPKVLFLVIHPKFVRYLSPIAGALPVATAFLTVNDPEMFTWLEARGLPRVRVQLMSESSSAKVGPFKYLASSFDRLAVIFNAVRQALTELRPDCIVVPEGNAPINELVNRVAKTLSIPTLCIQQGWAPVVHPGFRNMTYSRMCVWGQGFADLLAPHNPNQHFVATGNHAISGRQGDDQNRSAVAFFLQKDSQLISVPAWNGMLDLIAWTARSFPDREVRVREHPGAPLTAFELATVEGPPNIRLMPAEQATLEQVLAGCCVAVSMYSTTILEAAAVGAVPLILNVNGFDHYNPNIAADGAAIEVRDFAEARTALSRLIQDDEYRLSFGAALDRVRQRFFAGNRDKALAAIVAEIEKLRQAPRKRTLAAMIHSKGYASTNAKACRGVESS